MVAVVEALLGSGPRSQNSYQGSPWTRFGVDEALVVRLRVASSEDIPWDKRRPWEASAVGIARPFRCHSMSCDVVAIY